VAAQLRGGLERGENPASWSLVFFTNKNRSIYLQISGSGVEVKVDSGGSNGDRAEVGRVVVIAGVGWLRASCSKSSDGLQE
jgi:hypothetical protein